MSAPLTKIPEDALIYEALMRMEERGVRHLAVEDRDGQIVSVIDNKSLIQFQRYGSIVLTREISRSASPEEVAHHAERTPPLVKTLLDSSARPRHVTNMLAAICDSASERLVQLASKNVRAAARAFCIYRNGQPGTPGTNPRHRPGQRHHLTRPLKIRIPSRSANISCAWETRLRRLESGRLSALQGRGDGGQPALVPLPARLDFQLRRAGLTNPSRKRSWKSAFSSTSAPSTAKPI
jgi:hypothetical protein